MIVVTERETKAAANVKIKSSHNRMKTHNIVELNFVNNYKLLRCMNTNVYQVPIRLYKLIYLGILYISNCRYMNTLRANGNLDNNASDQIKGGKHIERIESLTRYLGCTFTIASSAPT